MNNKLIISLISAFLLVSCGTESVSSIISNSSSSVSESSSSLVESSSSTKEGCKHSNLEHKDYLEPTCEDYGNEEYYYCPDCQIYFDKNMEEVELSDLLIDPKHKLVKHDEVPGREQTSAEYYECSECHRYFNDEECSLEYDEGEWIVDGYALHWNKDETISTRAVNSLTLEELEGKAFAFEFKFLEDGYNFINFGQTISNTWTISGTFTLTRQDGNYSTDKGTLSAPDKDGWVTCTINKADFTGTGPDHHGADGLDVVFGGWKGYTDTCHAEFYIDGTSVRVVEAI